jgi:diguanylate cyclase (GGDEF)-like protein
MSSEPETGVRRHLQRIVERVTAGLRRNVPNAAAPGRSLVGRLLTAVVVTSLCVYLAAVAGLWWTGGRLIDDSARKQAVQWLAELDELGTPIYASRRPERSVRALSARLKEFPEILYVRYYDASGRRLIGEHVSDARATLPLTADRLRPPSSGSGTRAYRLSELRGARVRVTAPVQVRALPPDALLDVGRAPARESMRVIGYLDFVFDAGEQQARFERSLIGGSLALALVFGIAVVVGRRKIRQAMAPLTALEEPLARLARGDINVDMGGGGDREIAAIRNALNVTIAALKERADALRRAECDALTGLVNQRYFKRQLELERSHVERNAETSAVLCIDLDRFHEVNDAVGKPAGNRLLIQVAGLLRARTRENDLLARFEGDEFVALIRGVSRDGALKVARSINQVVQEFQFSAGDHRFPITVSIGIAMLDAAQPTAQPVLEQAMAACAEAKTRGGNRYQLHVTDEAKLGRDMDSPAWSRHVQTAIHDNALKFVYQPILDVSNTGGGEMYELLLRLVAPGGELVSPTAFLPVADRFGLIAELDRWVIRRACEELAQVQASGRSPTFFVNLSGHVFEDGEALMSLVSEQLARHKLRGESLVFEITEQAAIRQLDRACAVIEGLRQLGCRFALDDFGSGFSSLNYVKHLPAAFIKISGMFVQNMMADALDEVMVRSIVQIANAMGMQTVAESVEDRQTLQRIAELGVTYAQGHAIARPSEQLPDAEFFTSYRIPRAGAAPSTRPASSSSLARSLRKR